MKVRWRIGVDKGLEDEEKARRESDYSA